MHHRAVHSWIETDTETNGTATASRAAPPGGLSHYITSISASFSETAEGTLELKQGTDVVGSWTVYDGFALVFPSPIRLEPGNAGSIELGAGGAGIDGSVNLTGYTL